TIRRAALALVAALGLATAGRAASPDAASPAWSGASPAPGVYFYWYEPSFYTGFAPRTQDPARIHVELPRGNQVRLTVVLGPAELDASLGDLLLRRDTYHRLVDSGVMQLTTNRELERFDAELEAAGVAAAAAGRAAGGAEAGREQSLAILERLN